MRVGGGEARAGRVDNFWRQLGESKCCSRHSFHIYKRTQSGKLRSIATACHTRSDPLSFPEPSTLCTAFPRPCPALPHASWEIHRRKPRRSKTRATKLSRTRTGLPRWISTQRPLNCGTKNRPSTQIVPRYASGRRCTRCTLPSTYTAR
jgi:hypothetical protein